MVTAEQGGPDLFVLDLASFMLGVSAVRALGGVMTGAARQGFTAAGGSLRAGYSAGAAALERRFPALFKGPGCKNSFTPNTPVLTSSGLLPIASLLALDGTGNAAASSATQVWTYNEQTGKNELKPVNHVFINEDPQITYLELKNKDGSSENIITTPEHPFYVQEGSRNTPSSTGYGPAKANPHGDLGPNWVGAGHLKLGDQIRKFDGSSGTVVNVLTLAETRTMYNLDVVGNDNFFVGGSSWLVHNAKVEYGSTELSRAVMAYRLHFGLKNPAINLAAFEYYNPFLGKNSTMIFESGDGLHSEERALDFFEKNKIPTSNVSRVFSERNPCIENGHMCRNLLRENFGKAIIEHSFDYSKMGAVDSKRGFKELQAALKALFECGG